MHFEVTAPGVPEPDGTVVIKVGDRERTVEVKKGKAIARIVGMPPGRYRVRCQYAGGTYVQPGQGPRLGAGPGQGPLASRTDARDTEEPAGRILRCVPRASVVAAAPTSTPEDVRPAATGDSHPRGTDSGHEGRGCQVTPDPRAFHAR